MARTQTFVTAPNVTVPVAGTPVQVFGTSKFVKSCTIQALPTNTGRVFIGDSASQTLALDPGRGATFKGDNMDNGTTAKFDLAEIYIDAAVNGEGVSLTYTDGL